MPETTKPVKGHLITNNLHNPRSFLQTYLKSFRYIAVASSKLHLSAIHPA